MWRFSPTPIPLGDDDKVIQMLDDPPTVQAAAKFFSRWPISMCQERKRLKRERKAANPPHVVPPEESGVGLTVIHDPARGVTWPPSPDECFAIVIIKG